MPDLTSPAAAPEPRDAGLETRLLQADPAAFAAFFDCFFPRVYAFALRRTGDPERAERVTDAVLAAAIRDLAARPSGELLAAWVFRMAWRATAGAREDASAA